MSTLPTINLEECMNKPFSVEEIKSQSDHIFDLMRSVMKENVHYGKIPGCKKPSLLKPGAEKLLSTFHIAAVPEIEDLSTHQEIRYRVRCKGVTMRTEKLIGFGIGECSSNEEKYKWRRSICDQEWEETSKDHRRSKWVKPFQGEPYQLKQIRTQPSDQANTILKMAKKRALVDLTLTITAASDIFEQDIEEIPYENLQTTNNVNKEQPEIVPPQRASQNENPAVNDSSTVKVLIEEIFSKKGGPASKPWFLRVLKTSEGEFRTFVDQVAEVASTAYENHQNVIIQFKKNRYGNEITHIQACA